ncbi:MAG TPA: tripartite tricarboxylate transporter substrate binding protein [Thermodesulfobacteriota bacterium]|nr:tripartite tricarboxylate transporter substrate binding protein [Thermodesulfobacteriota bacterium]
MRRRIVVAVLALIFCGIGIGIPTVQAQPYPNRPIQLIISIPAGGGGDVNARLLADVLTKSLGVQIVPVNKPGAADTVGADAIAKSKKDGYTIGYTSSGAMVTSRIVNPENVHYDPLKDFDQLGLHVFFPTAFAVQESSPWKTFDELIEYAKKNPGKIRVSTTGLGSNAHFNLELIQVLTGAQLTHIPFKGGESVITAVLGGHVEATMDAIGKIIPHTEAKKLRVLLMTRKFFMFPNVPTITELGYKQELVSSWFGLFAPAGIPEEAKKVLVPALEKAINDPELKVKIENRGYITEYKSPADLRKLIASNEETVRTIAAKVGLAK